MASIKVRIGNKWMTVGNGGGSSGGSSEIAKEEIKNQVLLDVDKVLSDLELSLGDLEDYIDYAFKDGIISEVEKQKLLSYLNTLLISYTMMVVKYEEVYNNEYLSTARRIGLESSKENLDQQYADLRTAIQTAIEDSLISGAEDNIVDEAFKNFNEAINTLTHQLEQASKEIWKAMHEETTEKSQAYTDAIKETIQQDMNTLNGYLESLNGEVSDTKDYIDGAFADGIISVTEVSVIRAYLQSIHILYDSLVSQYQVIYGNSYLNQENKDRLANSKSSLDTAYTQLINAINTAITDNKATDEEKRAVNDGFTAFKVALSNLSSTLQTCLNSIMKAIADEVLENAKGYTDDSIARISNVVRDVESEVEVTKESIKNRVTYAEMNKYFAQNSLKDTTFLDKAEGDLIKDYEDMANSKDSLLELVESIGSDGVVYDNELILLEEEIAKLDSAYEKLLDRYVIINAFDELTGTLEETNMENAYNDFMIAQTQLKGYLNKIVEDQILGEEELRLVKIGFENYSEFLDRFFATMDSALIKVAQVKEKLLTEEAEAYANTYRKKIEDLSKVILEETVPQAFKDITASLTYVGQALTDTLRTLISNHRSTLTTQYNQLKTTLTEVLNNEYLIEGTGKLVLKSRISELETRFKTLDTVIGNILSSSTIKATFRNDFETAISLYSNAIKNAKNASDVALDEIINGKISGIESIAEYYAELKKQDAEKYADDLKTDIDGSITNVSNSLNETTNNLQAIHNSSAMQEVMRLQLSQYLRALGIVRTELLDVYSSIYNDSGVSSASKAELLTAKNNMETVYSEISEGIGDLLRGDSINISSYNAITEDLSGFETKAKELATLLSNCLESISDKRESDYVIARTGSLSNVLEDITNNIVDQRDTLESQKDGTVITTSELSTLNSLLDSAHSKYTTFISSYTSAKNLNTTYVNADDISNIETIYTTLTSVESDLNSNRLAGNAVLNVDNMKAYISKFTNYRAIVNTLYNALILTFGNYGINKSEEVDGKLSISVDPRNEASNDLKSFINQFDVAYTESVTLDKGDEYLVANLTDHFTSSLSSVQSANTNFNSAYTNLLTLNTKYPNKITNDHLTNLNSQKSAWGTKYSDMLTILSAPTSYNSVDTFIATGGAYEKAKELNEQGKLYITSLEDCINDIETALDTVINNEVSTYTTPLTTNHSNLSSSIKSCAKEASTIFANCYISDDVIKAINNYTNKLEIGLKALSTVINETLLNQYITPSNKSSLQTSYTNFKNEVKNCVDGVLGIAEDKLVYSSELNATYNSLLTSFNSSKTSITNNFETAVNGISGYVISNELSVLRKKLDTLFLTFKEDILNTIKSLATLLDTDSTITTQLEQLKVYMKSLETTYIDLCARYEQTYRNSYLSIDFLDDLESVKRLLDSNYNTLISKINSAIENRNVSDDEMEGINYAISDFNTQVENMSKKLTEALNIIEENRINGVMVGGRNLIKNSTFRNGLWAESYEKIIYGATDADGDGDPEPFKEIDIVERVNFSNTASMYNWKKHYSESIMSINVNTLILSTSAQQYTGVYQTAQDLNAKASKNYILSFDIKKISGTLENIGGHVDTNTFTANFVSVDGKSVTGSYSSSYTSSTLNDGNWHRVIVSVTTSNSIVSGNRLFIQPNRGVAKPYGVMVTNIQFKESESYSYYVLSYKDNTTIMSPDCSEFDSRLTTTQWVTANDNTAILDREGLMIESLDIIESNRFDIKKTDRKISFSANIRIKDFSEYDEHTIFWVQFYNGDNVVQRKYITIEDMGVTSMTNNAWYRLGYTITIGDHSQLDIFDNKTPDSCCLIITGTKNGHIEIKEVKAEVGDRWTEWSTAPEDDYSVILELSGRVSNAETIVTNSSIVDIVTSSTSFTSYFEGLASSSDLANYMTTENADNRLKALEDEIGKKFNALDYVTDYDLKSELERHDRDITAKFSATGGINLVHNSVGFVGLDSWTVDSTKTGTISIEQGMSALQELGSGSAFCFEGACKMSQRINKWIGDYCISAYYYSTSSDSKLTITCVTEDTVVEEENEDIITKQVLTCSGSTKGKWLPVSAHLNNNEKHANVIIENTGGGRVYVTCLIVHLGKTPLLWTTSPDEIYNSSVQMSMSGIRVNNDMTGRYVAITPEEFSGYAVVADESTGDLITEKVFTLNDDVTEVTKLYAKKDIQVAGMKVVQVNTSSRNGIAFIPAN